MGDWRNKTVSWRSRPPGPLHPASSSFILLHPPSSWFFLLRSLILLLLLRSLAHPRWPSSSSAEIIVPNPLFVATAAVGKADVIQRLKTRPVSRENSIIYFIKQTLRSCIRASVFPSSLPSLS